MLSMKTQAPVSMGHWTSSSVIKTGVAGLVSLAVLAGCSAPTSQDKSSASAPAVASKSAAKEPELGGLPPHLRLVSQDQYFNTLANIFGEDAVPKLSFAPPQRTEGLLATGSAYVGITDSQVEKYQRTAAIVADLVVAPERRDFIIPCKPANPKASDKACAEKFLSHVGMLLYRRPLTQAKVDEIVDVAVKGADKLEDFYAGLSLALEATLLSPKTLFIDETYEPDPKSPGQMRLDAYSLASRLSFFLWNQAPDDALLAAAAKGDLFSAKGRAKVIDMMLASPKLEAGVRAFFNDMLGFDDFDNLAKDPKVYPAFTGAAVEGAREQTLRMIVDHLVTNKGDYRDLFTSRATFISPALAPLYHQPSGTSWTPYQAPADSPRVGLLTQISFLALHSHPGRSSPTLRGKALRELLLCQPVPRPPANVDFSAVENPDPTLKTARDRLDFHRRNPVCAGCHKITDPMGLALENFDGSGQYRETENGAAIDASGSLDGKDFKDAVGLGQVLHDSPTVSACIVRRVFSYGVGGRSRPSDAELLKYFNEHFAAGGYRLPELMKSVAMSDAFVEINNQPAQPAPVKTASN